MLIKSARIKRSGTHVVECALVYPVTFFLIYAIMIGSMGVYRFQEMAHVARDGARYACTHGGEYSKDNATAIAAGTLPNVTKSYIVDNIIKPKLFLVDKTKITVDIYFNSTEGSTDWDSAKSAKTNWPNSVYTNGATKYSATNTVSVTVKYDWYPEMFIPGPVTIKSVSCMPMSY